jgi:hypothetical protein
MRCRLRLLTLGLSLLTAAFGARTAAAAQYNVIATAGANGDSHENLDDPLAEATFEPGAESYAARANTAGGLLLATALRGPGALATGMKTSAARIEETIILEEVPSGPVTFSVTLAAELTATANAGIALAESRVSVAGCRSVLYLTSIQGVEDLSFCPGGTAGGGTATITLSAAQLISSNLEIGLEAQVTAGFQLPELVTNGYASASGGVPLSVPRGGAPLPSTVYVNLDPPLAHHYAGSMTFFPVPEPGAPLLLAAGGVILFASSRRHPRAR